ncbi:MAG: CHASE domain-containing protein, partial [Myxococcota bacterium]|nr:CHASE domain-containing protein [Myxococcota bacterium]
MALAGAIASVAAAYVVARSEDRVAAARFERRVVQASLAIEHRLWQDLSAVESTAALFTASGDVTHEQFRIATAHFLARHPSLRAISWNPRILSRDRRAHEEALRGEGFADYRVTERAASGQLTAAGRREEHVV